MIEKEKIEKKIDIGKTVTYLTQLFNELSGLMTRKFTPEEVRQYQVDFCYLIDGIQRGAPYIVTKTIAEANELINTIKLKLKHND